MRLTERHAGVAVFKNKHNLKEAVSGTHCNGGTKCTPLRI